MAALHASFCNQIVDPSDPRKRDPKRGVVFLKNKPIDLSLRRKTPTIETSLLGNFIQPNLKIDDPYFSAMPRLKSIFSPKKGPRLISPRRRAPNRNVACTILKSQERK